MSVLTLNYKSAQTAENPVESGIHTLQSQIIDEIEKKICAILDEDKKLESPVFLFVKKNVPKRMAQFIAGAHSRPVAVGIAGQSASGKSSIANDIIEAIENFQDKNNLPEIITRINTDDYYYDRSDMVKAAGSFAEFAKNYDLDRPEAFELDLLRQHIELLLLGQEVLLPKYDMSGTAIRFDNNTPASPNNIIITEGLYCLTDKVNDVFDFSIYVDVSPEVQKERWYARATMRNIVGASAKNVFENVVNKAEIYVKPSANNADIIINGETSRKDYKNIVQQLLAIVESMLEFRTTV